LINYLFIYFLHGDDGDVDGVFDGVRALRRRRDNPTNTPTIFG